MAAKSFSMLLSTVQRRASPSAITARLYGDGMRTTAALTPRIFPANAPCRQEVTHRPIMAPSAFSDSRYTWRQQRNGFHRFVSSAPSVKTVETSIEKEALSVKRDNGADAPLMAQVEDTVPDFTSDKSKSGTPSPWAVFDAWGAVEGIIPPLSPQDEALLSDDAVRIPLAPPESPLGAMENQQNPPSPESEILKAYDKHLQRTSSVHFGYPYNLAYDHRELHEFMKYSINNLGDPFLDSNYGVHSRQFERAVVDFFAKLWKLDMTDSHSRHNHQNGLHCSSEGASLEKERNYWGYVTTCGTEGNLHGILLARERFPDGVLYSSRESHYSVFKAARYYRMEAHSVPTLPMGEIDYDILATEIERNLYGERPRPIIINVNIGTTVKGAVDDLGRILRILSTFQVPRHMFHIHCDGALFAMMMPFVDYAPEISFDKLPIDSMVVSGHKMLGCPMPCGVALARSEHVRRVEQRIDYLNSVDTTIMGSRNGQAALHMWYSLRKKGIDGITRDVKHCMGTAQYLRCKITEAGLSCRLNDLSCTVVLERPMDDAFVRRWQLACEDDISHVVVMPNVTRDKIDAFVSELVASVEAHGRRVPSASDSPLSKLTSSAWGGHSCVLPASRDRKST